MGETKSSNKKPILVNYALADFVLQGEQILKIIFLQRGFIERKTKCNVPFLIVQENNCGISKILKISTFMK